MNRRNQLIVIVGSAACALLSACASSPTSQTSPHPAANEAAPPSAEISATISNAGNYKVSYVTHPAPIPLNEPFKIEFWIEPAGEREALGEISVDVDARMPQHHHGMYRLPRVQSLGGDHFEAAGLLFHMPGYWEIYFDITSGGVTERAQFAVEIDG